LARLYLIRRNLESFIGPLTVDSMRDAYKRMAFGLQDEVCGHAGDWVGLDDIEKLKQVYPDVAKVVSQDMLGGWGMGENTGLKMMNDDTGQVFVNNRGRTLKVALAFLMVALITFAAAMYFNGKGKLSGKLIVAETLPTVEQMNGYVQTQNTAQLIADLEDSQKQLVESATTSKAAFTEWIPYLRLYAFSKDGMVDGIRPKILRGSDANAAPTDCSLATWRRRWKKSVKSWPAFLEGKKLMRSHWARLLAWDPHWIARRESSGWIQPKNYYIGCIEMARKSLQEITLNNGGVAGNEIIDWQKYGLAEVSYRLDWLNRVASGGVLIKPDVPTTSITRWICMESSRSVEELNSCKVTLGSATQPSYDSERYAWNVVRLVLATKGKVPPKTIELANSVQPLLRPTDYFTRFDYRPELRVIKTLIKQGGSIDSIASQLSVEFPDVNLAH